MSALQRNTRFAALRLLGSLCHLDCHVNGIDNTLNCPLKLFANDIKIYCIVNNVIDAIKFQIIIDSIERWCNIWQLKINVAKSLILHLGTCSSNANYSYHLSGSLLPNPLIVPYLGISINPSLSFAPHIVTIVSKARARCAVFLKTFVSRDSKTMVKFFIAYVRPCTLGIQ